jgi:Ricin-type beta-trefoil lectin domain
MVIWVAAPRVVAEVDQTEKVESTMHELRMMGGAGRALIVVSTLICVAVLSAGGARADGPVQVRSRLGDACLDAPGGNWYAAVVVNPCNGSDSQRWNLNGRQLQSVSSGGGCLINPAGDSVFAHLGPCIGMWNQNWNIDPNGRIATDPGWLCLSVLGGPGPGTWVSTRYCNGDPGQGWDIVR